MAGRLVGEVNHNSGGLAAAGVSDRARQVLSAIAEDCREHDRRGCALLPYLALVTGDSERSVTRALTELRRLGLLRVVRRGGGRGHEQRPAVYELADLQRWLADRHVTWVASQWEAVHAFTRHPAGESIEDPLAIDSPPGVDSIGIDSPASADSLAKSAPLTRHLGGDLSRSPVTDRGGTTDVTTGPHAPSPDGAPAVASAPAPQRPSPRPRTATAPAAAPAGRSLCGNTWCPGLRGDRACRSCGDVRNTAAAAEAARLQAIREQRRRDAELAEVERNSCPWQCVDGIRVDLATRQPVECDHRPLPRQWVAETLRSTLRPGRPSPRLQRPGRHSAPEPAAAAGGGAARAARDPADPPDTPGSVIAS